jgi:hypothetical protein
MCTDWKRSEALAAFFYSRRNIRVQQIYLDDDIRRNPQSDHEYSKWKLQEAHDDLRVARERLEALGLSWLDLNSTGED